MIKKNLSAVTPKEVGADKTKDQKIHWYRRRWFWGVVMGVVFVLVYLQGGGLLSAIHVNFSLKRIIWLFLVQFPFGLFIIAWRKGVAIYYKFTPTQSYIYLIIYYIANLILIFETFYRKRVKIRYPLIAIATVIISLFGFFVLYALN